MSILTIAAREVHDLLPMDECIEAMANVLRSLASGHAVVPLRQVIHLPGTHNALATMPAALAHPFEVSGVKIITIFPDNTDSPHDAHQGAVLLFESEYGRLCAIVDGTAVTAVRTAAVSAVATRSLARSDAGDLAILGSGVQAEQHLQAMLHVRPVHRVRVWSARQQRVQAFARRMSRTHDVEVEACRTAFEAVRGADIICTATSSREPVLAGEWVAPGAHINAVGTSVATARELDSATVARARLFVDRRESALAEAGDFLMARAAGAVSDDHILGEIGEVLLGVLQGRRSDDEVTLFKSVGLAVEDVAAAHLIYTKALARAEAHLWLNLTGEHDARSSNGAARESGSEPRSALPGPDAPRCASSDPSDAAASVD